MFSYLISCTAPSMNNGFPGSHRRRFRSVAAQFSLDVCSVTALLLGFATSALPQQQPNLPLENEDSSIQSASSSSVPQALSAESIIAVLQQQPELLAAAREEVAMRWTVDSDTIKDDTIFYRVRQDADLRAEITRELIRRGYDVNRNPERKVQRTDGQRQLSIDSQQNNLLGEDNGGDDSEVEAAHPWQDAKDVSAEQMPRAWAGRRGQFDGDLLGDKEEKTGAKDRRREDEETVEPRMLHRPNPYPKLPSLEDLYSQFPSSETKLKRFGSAIFRHGTGNADGLPMDLPAGPDYVLGPGDGLVLNLWGSLSERLHRTIDRQGQIDLPEAGTVTLAGESIAHAQEMIEKALNQQFQKIRVEISLARLRTVRVYVVGDVQRPGAYDISSLSTALNALYAAGGPTANGSLRLVRHYRGKDLVREVDLYDLLLRGVRSDVDRLLAGDSILVPPVGTQVAVGGMVRRPAIYELKGERGLDEVLDLAGGVLVSAALRQIQVERTDAHERHTMLSIRLPEDGNRDATTAALAAFHPQDGDRVLVSPILPYNDSAVYLQGHVFRPGKYPYREGITVNELLRSYQDLLPEPADHAEIVRLQAPDFRPKTIGFNLSEVLIGDDPIVLQPFDVIRVFSRYEIDPPKVAIRGEVLRPGEYPLADGMTLAGLVNMAGGFKRSAYREQADLASYVVKNGEKILIANRVVEIGKAFEGDASADVKLKAGDLVGVRQLTGWTDIGASVRVSGEVVYPGAYGINEGERLSSVLKRVGGFRETAYPAGAVLERVQVREMGEKARLEMIRRVESASPGLKGGMIAAQEQVAALQAMEQQRQQILIALRAHSASGRMVIRISSDITKWQNTPADIEMRAGDVLIVPKRPNFVMVSGQVYNATAISYLQGRDAAWYLRQAGGPTQSANKKGIFILRADGSVVGQGDSFASWWRGNVLTTHLRPGDSIVVPERITGGSMLWRNVMAGAQLASSAATVGLTAAYLGR